MKRVINCVVFVTIVFAVATASSAATLSLTSGPAVGSPVSGPVPLGAPNDLIGPANLLSGFLSISGYYGATIRYSVIGTGSVTIEFFGGEANFHDQLFYNAGSGFFMPPGFDHAADSGRVVAASLATPIATFVSPITGSGVLPFEFMIEGLPGPVNGSNLLNTSLVPNFFAACIPLTTVGPAVTTCDSLWVFLDDNGGNHDNDHDDFVMRITAKDAAVSEASSLALLFSGLAGISLFSLKLKK